MEDFNLGFVGGCMVGVIAGLMIASLLTSPMYVSLDALCDQKYGVDNWTSNVNGGYWVCEPKINVICKLDGIGIDECNKKVQQ